MFDTSGSLTNRVLGVDACKSGWVGVRLGEPVTTHFARHIADLVHDAFDTDADTSAGGAVIAIDIPIGLATASRRQADVLGREFLGRRSSSLFMTPVRDALEAETHVLANTINHRRTGQGISIQAFSLREKILQVDAWLATAPCPVLEIHPEMSFAELAGAPLPERKKTWAGAERRRELLAGAGIVLSGGLSGVDAGVDDVLDAAVAAWTARRYLAGEAIPLPDPPEELPGRQAAIWR